MALNGALAGLVSITAEPSPSPGMAVIIGAIGGILVVLAIPLLDKLKIDDVVSAVSGSPGLPYLGHSGCTIDKFRCQFCDSLSALSPSAPLWLLPALTAWLALKFTVGIRVSKEVEMNGCDASELGMEAYPDFRGGSSGMSSY